MTASNLVPFSVDGSLGRFDFRHARIPAVDAQTARADSLHMFGIGVERSHLGNGREGGGKQAADGTASDDEDPSAHRAATSASAKPAMRL